MAIIRGGLAACLLGSVNAMISVECVGNQCDDTEILLQSGQSMFHVDDFSDEIDLVDDITGAHSQTAVWLTSSILTAALLLGARRFFRSTDEPLKKPRVKVVEAEGPQPKIVVPGVVEFHAAIRENQTEACQEMLDLNSQLLSEQDVGSCTALHIAAHSNAEAVAQLLLRLGASPDARDAWNETPIFFAARAGSTAIATALIESGADINPTNLDGLTPLMAAAQAGQRATCQLLLDRGASAQGVSDDEMPSLLATLLVTHILEQPAQGSPAPVGVVEFHTAVSEDRAELCHSMLKRNRQLVSERDAWSCTGLHIAANANAEATTQVLLEFGASPDARDAWNETPIFFAVRSGSAAVAKMLIETGADISPQNLDGLTPLVTAAKAGQEATCKLLLDHGASADGIADDEMPPLLTALLVSRVFITGSQSE